MANVSQTPPEVLGVEDVAEALGVSRSLVYTLLKAGKLPSVKLGRRRGVTRRQLATFLAELEAENGA